MNLYDSPKLNAEGYCRKCGAPLGISGQCVVCAVNDNELPRNPPCPECGCPMAAVSGGFQCEDCTREMLGKEVRRVWVEYCLEIGDYKPSHLATWDKLDEQDKEVDRRIGEAIMKMVIKKRLSYLD